MSESTSNNPSEDTDAGQTSQRTHMSIGEVLNRLQDEYPDISISKIRFLESRGLVEPHRAPSGYRKFSPTDLDRLRWILTMQRDHFLPLRVIKERLDAGGPLTDDETGADDVETAPATLTVAKPKTSRFRSHGPDADDLDATDLARLAALSAQQFDQLVKFGLLESHETADGPRFRRDEVRIAKAAGAFLQHGIEARHLKAWRVAAEREAGMLEQIVTPIARKGTGASGDRAREVADELVDMGNVIREAIIVKSLRDRLGFGSDQGS